jgi:hypothetical protein
MNSSQNLGDLIKKLNLFLPQKIQELKKEKDEGRSRECKKFKSTSTNFRV